jgi:hypothetical protein
MSGGKRGGIPEALTEGWEQFEAWRRSRKVGTRIPDTLWSLSVTLAKVPHNDDTTIRILELMGERFRKNPPTDDDREPGRTGLFTSGVVATSAGRRIALFFSGRRHAGENLSEVLKHRAEELESPVQMCDGLARNLPQELDTILANCLAHGRRNFVELHDRFPEECRHVIEAFKVIYPKVLSLMARETQIFVCSGWTVSPKPQTLHQRNLLFGSGPDPFSGFVQFLVVKILELRRGERTTENRHPLFPLCFPNDCQSLNVGEVLQIELQVFPKGTRTPAVEIAHDEKDPDLAVPLNCRFGHGNEFFIGLLGQFASDLNFDDLAFHCFGNCE